MELVYFFHENNPSLQHNRRDFRKSSRPARKSRYELGAS